MVTPERFEHRMKAGVTRQAALPPHLRDSPVSGVCTELRRYCYYYYYRNRARGTRMNTRENINLKT